MRMSKAEIFNQKVWEAEFYKNMKIREKFYQQIVEKRHRDELDRVAKNRRLGLDKGQNVDIDC